MSDDLGTRPGGVGAGGHQPEASRLLEAALRDGHAHAYLFHGPPGIGKRDAALAFAGSLVGDLERVRRRAHPDVYVLEPLGDQIRIDAIRALRHDLHMRPFEAERRVYLIFGAQELNEEAADALLKDLEEPPPYAVIVLVADELGPLPETIRSRCQLVPFRRLSERAVREWLSERAPGLEPAALTAIARVAAGRLDRAERLLDPDAVRRRAALLEAARAVYLDAEFDAAQAAEQVLGAANERGGEAKVRMQERVDGLDLPGREGEQWVRRAERGAAREELLASLEELAAWYRDLVVVAAGADGAAIHFDRLDDIRADASKERAVAAEEACERVRETWRTFEELNVTPGLALEALFIQLRQTLAGPAVGAAAATV